MGSLRLFTIFVEHMFVDFEYRSQALSGSYSMKPSPTEEMTDYKFKFYLHSGRFSYNYGWSFGKYRTTGIYFGAALYGGTFDMKMKYGDKKYQRQTSHDLLISKYSPAAYPHSLFSVRTSWS